MNWIKAHPYQAVCFTAYFSIVACFAGFMPQFWVQFLVIFILGLVVWACLFQIYKPLMVVTLCALLTIPAPQAKAAQRKGGGVVIGVVIICGMTYCIYRLARFCQQHFPPPNTNNVNNAFGPALPGGWTNFAASFALTSDPCVSDAGTNFVISPTSFTINAMVQGGQLRTAVFASGDSSSMEEFISGVQAQGLVAGTTSYAIDGEPAPASSVPISYQPTTGTITNGVLGTAFLITVQASSDMQTWQTLFSTTAGEGTAFQVQDTVTSTAMFYRLILQ